jgi:YesN/AraC family two-component response regulator
MEAVDATEGLDILGNNHVDLIITDFVMPNTSGFQLIAQVRQKWPRMPILLVSGYLTPEVGEIVSDGVEFIPKPVQMPVLLEAIQRLVPKQWVRESFPSSYEIFVLYVVNSFLSGQAEIKPQKGTKITKRFSLCPRLYEVFVLCVVNSLL